MQLPALQGTFDQQEFFIYAACDHDYFEQFGRPFINSIKFNTDCNIHVHLFNPSPAQIDFCQRNGVGVTWEHVHKTLFVKSAQRWSSVPIMGDPDRNRYDRTLNAMSKGGDASVIDRMQKTYYACARFIRLAQLRQQQSVLAADIDAIVRAAITSPGTAHDFYLHYISGRKARYLAGGLWLNSTEASQQFLKQYADQLSHWFEQDYVYWGLDQDLLDDLVPRFNHGQLPISYIDWNMNPNSVVWTAKGTRKELDVFVNERSKYTA